MRRRTLVGILILSLASCGGSEAPGKRTGPGLVTMESPLAKDAKTGVDDTKLQALLVRHWDAAMQSSPVWATGLGDHRFDTKLSDPSAKASAARQTQALAFLAEVDALLSGDLSDRDRISASLLSESLLRKTDRHRLCQGHLWNVSARGNPVSSANVLPDDHKITDLKSAENLLQRYRQIPQSVDEHILNLRAGLAQGKVANAQSIRLTAELVERQMATATTSWSLYKVVDTVARLQGLKKDPLSNEFVELIDGEIKASFARYLSLLKDELLPAGRVAEKVGMHALPEGLACYEASVRAHINLDRSADEIHALGLKELEQINADMAALGQKLFGTTDLASTVAHLRTSKELHFTSEEEIVAKAESSLARAKAAIPRSFGVLPKADCTVVKIPDFEAPYTTIAYYKEPQPDGAKPGEYYINTYKPETRPRFEMEVLAYHESIPGHHLQIAISQEQEALPLFRRYGGSTAFVEGWALYTERLADEMGLYSGDLDRMGMLSYDAWRASRLVVDTGIHAKAWTREQAENFMQVHTALTQGNIKNEVDRYISWPGQAVAYKTGQVEIFRLRAMAQEALGEAFVLADFHDTVLKQGAVTLPVLAAQVEAWIASLKP